MNGSRRATAAWVMRLLGLAALATIVLVVFWPVTGYPFITLDDDVYVYANPFVREGLTGRGIAWALTADLTWDSPNADYWQPVTMLSRMLDVTLFGMNAGGHHLVNLLLHATSAILLAILLETLLVVAGTNAALPTPASAHGASAGAIRRFLPAAILGAALWALHPLAVGSVAWVTDRKSVLSTLFALASLLAHVRLGRGPWKRWASFVLPLFALALMTKPTTALLPVIFLLLDLWPLGLWPLGLWPPGSMSPGVGVKEGLERTWRLPALHLALCLPLGLFSLANAFLAQRGAFGIVPMMDRILHVPVAVEWYTRVLLHPPLFACFYPYPASAHPLADVARALLVVFALIAAAVMLRRRLPALGIGLSWFLVMLAPVVLSTHEAWATRFGYAPSIGWTLPVAALLAHRRPVARIALGALAILAVLMLAAATSRQLPAWRSSQALYETALEATGGRNHFIQRNLGILALEAGRHEEAERWFQASLADRPEHATYWYNIGVLRERQGRETEALACYGKALEANPGHANALFNRATLALARGDLAAADSDYVRALASKPGSPETLNNLAVARLRGGRPEEALALFAAAHPWHPRPDRPALGAASACLVLGRLDEARGWFLEVLKVDPANEHARQHLDRLLQQGGPSPSSSGGR